MFWIIPLSVAWIVFVIRAGKRGRIVALCCFIVIAATDQIASTVVKPMVQLKFGPAMSFRRHTTTTKTATTGYIRDKYAMTTYKSSFSSLRIMRRTLLVRRCIGATSIRRQAPYSLSYRSRRLQPNLPRLSLSVRRRCRLPNWRFHSSGHCLAAPNLGVARRIDLRPNSAQKKALPLAGQGSCLVQNNLPELCP